MRSIKKGATSQSVYFEFLDSASTTGGRKTGLAFNTSGIVAYYARNGAAAVAITLATQTAAGAWSSGGFAEVDATNMPGLYRLDVPNAAFASGAESVVITMKGAAGMAQASLEIALVDNTAADIYGRVGAPAGASIAADIASVQADTGNIKTRLPAALVSGRMDSSIGAVASGVIAAASFAANALDAVWSTATRVLTAGTNIALAKGTGITGFNDLSTAQVKAQADQALVDVGLTTIVTGRVDAAISTRMAAASYTAPDNATISAINAKTVNLPPDPADASDIAGAFLTVNGSIGTLQTTANAINAKTTNLPAAPAAVSDIPTANANADALLDRANGVETGWTLRQALRIVLSALGGKLSGAATSTVTIRNVGDSKDRVVATVDVDGNRTAVTLDAT